MHIYLFLTISILSLVYATPTLLTPRERSSYLSPLLAAGWSIPTGKEESIYREIILKDFNQAWGLMTRIAMQADKMDHHPEWSNVSHRYLMSGL
jgi:4a-hydroxytetrahydrobiopterin dehydratase